MRERALDGGRDVDNADADDFPRRRVEAEAGKEIPAAALELLRVRSVTLEPAVEVLERSSRDVFYGASYGLDVQNDRHGTSVAQAQSASGHFRGMKSATARRVVNLVTAGSSRRNEGGRFRRSPRGGREPPLRHLDRHVVVLLLVAEGARHPAAPGVHEADFPTQFLQEAHQRLRSHERLEVAVAVEEERSRRVPHGKTLASQKLLEKKAPAGQFLRLVPRH